MRDNAQHQLSHTFPMILGPNLIMKISPSGSLVKIETIVTGNSAGARHWTDGKRDLPMFPDEPWLRRHPDTDELFWTDDCEEISEGESPADQKAYQDIPFAEEPRVEDYQRALGSGVASTREKERYIRTRYWWAANDAVRDGEATAPSVPDFRENLLKLRALLDVTDAEQRLMAAEISRQLGDFTAATLLLDFEFPADYAGSVHVITKLTAEEDFTVRQVPDPSRALND